MKIAYTIMFLLMAINLYSQSNWFWQNPSSPSNYLYNIQSLSETVLFSVGSGGTILKSTNGGLNFSIYPTGINTDLRGLNFPDLNTGYATGSGGKIYKTTNTGVNWNLMPSGVTSIINSVYFRNPNSGWAVTNNGVCLRTTNGGNNWTTNTVTSNELRSVFFSDDLTGYAAGGQSGVSSLFKTTNGGINWTALNTGTPGFLYSVFFINNNTGWAAGQNQIIIKTTDAGQTWIQQNAGTGTVWFWSVKFFNENTGWASGLDKIFKTTNGGDNWNPVQVFNPNASLNFTSVSLLSASLLFSCGTSGMVVKSTNAGDNWTSLQTGPTINFSSIQFLNSNIGFVSGFLGLIGPASIYKSTNGGNVWVQQSIPSVQNLYDIAFLNTEVGIACGRGSKILVTTNGGVNWDLNFTGVTSSEILYSASFLDSNTAFTAGGYFNSAYYGLLFKTTNKGANWNKVTLSDSSGTFYSIQFINSLQGFACGTGGKLIKTSDGGNNWNIVSSGVTSDLRCVFFLNSLTGWISGASGVIKKTTNSGLNWTVQTSGTTGNLYSVIFTDENNGHAAGNFGVIKTANGGLTWTADIVQTSNPVNSIFFINNSTGWLAGDYGTIMRTDNGTTNIRFDESKNAKDYIISMSYPNPFNPNTKIRISIPYGMKMIKNLSLKIIDITGKEITTLYNNHILPGTYEFEWNASEYSSGIYFYNILAGNISITNKLIYIK